MTSQTPKFGFSEKVVTRPGRWPDFQFSRPRFWPIFTLFVLRDAEMTFSGHFLGFWTFCTVLESFLEKSGRDVRREGEWVEWVGEWVGGWSLV